MTIGKMIETARNNAKISKNILANIVNLDLNLYEKIENDEILPTKKILLNISSTLNISYSQFNLEILINQMSIGEMIRWYRLISGLQPSELAKKVNITPNYILQIENETRLPGMSLLLKIADILDLKCILFQNKINIYELSIGEQVRLYRKMAGCNLTDFCKKIHMQRSTLHNIESNSMFPTYSMLKRIAKGLGINIKRFKFTCFLSNKTDGEIFKFFRDYHKKSLRDVSQMMNISFKELKLIEQGMKTPTRKQQTRLSRYFSFDIAVFGIERMTKGELVGYYREMMHISQDDLSHKINNLNVNILKKIEENRIKVNQELLFEIADNLCLDISNFGIDLETIGGIIKSNRESLGLTRNDLSVLSGVSSNTIFLIEHNLINLPNKNIKKIAKILNISLVPFIQETNCRFDEMSRGEIICYLRKSACKSQEELAKAVGISSTFLSLIERNLRVPNKKTKEKIAKELKVETSLLL